MFFTQEDYIKIQQWLIKNSVKDTEFNEATIPFNGNEIVSIVQGNQNKKVFLKDLVSQIFNLGVSDFVNITDKYDAPNISLEEAIRLIPSRARKEGQVITFLNKEDGWNIYQFKGALNQWNILDQWKDLFEINIEDFIIDSILPDEEDLTKSLSDENGNSYLSLKNREYNPNDFSGLGRIILRKNIIDSEDPIYGKVKKNILYQDMFTQGNTIYEIRYDFDLNDAEITIPEGCVLDFQGGSLNNGKIKSVNGYITGKLNNSLGVTFEGLTSLNKNVVSSWLIEWKENSLSNLISLCPNNGKITLDASFNYTTNTSCFIKKNIIVDGGGNKIFITNGNRRVMNLFTVTDCNYFTLVNLEVDGNADNYRYNTFTNEYFITINNVSDVKIENCTFHNIDSDFNNWEAGMKVALIKIENYQYVSIKNNNIYNVTAPEGIALVPNELTKLIPYELVSYEGSSTKYEKFIDIENNISKYNNAINYCEIENNSFEWNYVSSHIIIYFGKCKIKNNTFHTCVGSAINSFCYNSIIADNKILGCLRETHAIDLTEQDVFNFMPDNVLIDNNFVGRCKGAVEFYKGSNITISNNRFDATSEEKDSNIYKNLSSNYPSSNSDYAIQNAYYSNNILVCNNHTIGFSSIMNLNSFNKIKSNIHIHSNRIELGNDIKRTAIHLIGGENIIIDNNIFIGTVINSALYRLTKQEYAIFVSLYSNNDVYNFKNIIISNNTFIQPNYSGQAILFYVDVYDINTFTHLPHLENITVVNNTCNLDCQIGIVSDCSDSLNNDNDFTIENPVIKGNKAKIVGFLTNVNCDCDFSIVEDKKVPVSNDINGYLGIQYTGCFVTKGTHFYINKAASDLSFTPLRAEKNIFLSIYPFEINKGYQSGRTFVHGDFVYFQFKDGVYSSDFNDTPYDKDLGIIRIGPKYNYNWEYISLDVRPSAGPSYRDWTEQIMTAKDERYIGHCYFDTSTNKPKWWTGSKWVDATGADV